MGAGTHQDLYPAPQTGAKMARAIEELLDGDDETSPPALDARGLLPPGLHTADLEAVPPTSCTNDHRSRLWDSAVDGIDALCDLLRATELPGHTELRDQILQSSIRNAQMRDCKT